MNLGLLYYFILIVSKLRGVIIWLAIMFGIVAFIKGAWYLGALSDGDVDAIKIKESFKKWFIITFSFIALSIFFPNKKEVLMISGLTIADSPIKKTAIEVQELFPNLIKLINKEIEKELKELKGSDGEGR